MDFNSLIAELRASSENLPKDSADRSLLSSVYCNKACKVLDEVAESTDYDTVITGLWLVTAHFAEQLAYLKPVPALSELCFKLFRQCAKAVLNIQWQNLEEDSSLRQNFLASLGNLHGKLVPFDFPRFRLLEALTENPWTNPTLAKVMGGEVEDGDKEEVRAYIEQEDPIILQLRVDMMLQENCEEYALNLCNNCLSHPELQSDLGVRKIQLSLLYKLGQEDKLQEECQKLNIQDAVRIIKQLQTSETHRQICTVLAQTFMVQNWIRPSDMEANKELLRLWIRHQLLVDREQDQFKESVWAMAKLSQSTEQIVIFIDVLREECGEIFLQLYVDMCIFAINVDKGQMETNKKEGNMEAAAARRSDMASICAKLSCLCHHASIKVARICALTSFALKPTEQSFLKIGTFYGQGTDCCNKCGRDRNREPGTINPATLYEVERLLSMLRPDYLSPDQSYTNIQILCRKFLQDSLKNAQQLQRQQMIAQNSGITTLIDGAKITAPAGRPTNVFEALSAQDYHNTQMLLNRIRIQSITQTKASTPGSPGAQHRYKGHGSLGVHHGEPTSPVAAGQVNKAQYMFDVEKIKSKQPYGVPVEQQHQYYLMKHEKELEQRRKNAQKKREGKTQQGVTSNPQMQQQAWQPQQNQQHPKQQQQHGDQVNEMIQSALQDSDSLQKLTQSANPSIVQAVINIMKGSVVQAAASSELKRQQAGSQQMKPVILPSQHGTQPLPTVSTLLKPSVQAQKQQNQEHLHARQQQSPHTPEQSPSKRHPRPQLYAQPIVVSTASSLAPQRYQPSVVNRNNSSPASSSGEKQKGEGFVLAKSHVEDIRRLMQMQMSNLQQKQIAEPQHMSGSTVTVKNTSIVNTSLGFTSRPRTTVELAEQAALAKLQKHDSSKPGMFQQSQQLNSNNGQMFMSHSKQAVPQSGQQLQFTPSMNITDSRPHHQPPHQHQQKLLQSDQQQMNTFSFPNSPTSNLVCNPVLPSDELAGSIMGIDDTIIKELLQDSGILANTFPDIDVETVGEDKSKFFSLPHSATPPLSTQMPKSSNSQLYNYMSPPVSQTSYTTQGLPASHRSAQANSITTAQPQKTAGASHQLSVRAANKNSQLPAAPCSSTVSHSPLNPSMSRLGDKSPGKQHPSWADMKANLCTYPKENASYLYNRKEIKDELKPTVDQLREIMKKEDIEGEVCMDAANNATYRCIICSIAFESLDYLREHVRNVCKPGLQSSSVYNTKIKQDRANSAKAGVETTTVFQCLRCFELCVSDAGIKQHRLTCKRVPTVPSDLKKDSMNNKQKVMSKSAVSKQPPKKVPKDHADMMPDLPLPFPYPSLNAEAVLKNISQTGSLNSQTSDSKIESRRHTRESSSNLISKSTVAVSIPLPTVLTNTAAGVSTTFSGSSSASSCLGATSQASSLGVNTVRQTPVCSTDVTTSVSSMEDVLVLPDDSAETVTNCTIGVQRDLEIRDTKPVTQEVPETILQPNFTEITGSGGSKFYKCGLCSQTLCSHESFLVHWKECAVKNKNLMKKLELKEKACNAKPISGEVLENLVSVIADVAAGSGSIPESISLDSEFSDVSDYYCLRDPCKAGLLDMGESSEYLDSDFWYDSADSNSPEGMSEDGVDTGETGDGSITGSGFTDTMDVSKDGENEYEKDTDEGIKDEEGDKESNQSKRRQSEEMDEDYVSTRKAPPKLRDRKTLKPIHSFINETFNSPFSKTSVKQTHAISYEKLRDETEEDREKQTSESEVESDGNSLYCKVCKTSFQNKRILLQHFAGKHLQPYTVKTVADSSSYFCHLCQKMYPTFMFYMHHVPNHSVTIYEKMKAFRARMKSQQRSQRIALQRGLAKKASMNQKSKKAASKSAVDRLEQQLLAGKTQAVRERMKISKKKRSLQSAFTSSEDDFSSDASNNVVFKSKKSESENREPTTAARQKRSTYQPHQTDNTNSPQSSLEQSEEEEDSDGKGPRLARDQDDDYVLSEDIDSDSVDSTIAPPTTRSRNRVALNLGVIDSKTGKLTDSSELNEGVFVQNDNDGLKCLPGTPLEDFDADSNCSDLLLSQCQNGHFVPVESQLGTQDRPCESSSIAEDTQVVESGKEFVPGRTLIVRRLSRQLKESLKSCDLHPTVVLKALPVDVATPYRQEVNSSMDAVDQQPHSSSSSSCEQEPAQLDSPTQQEASTSAAVKARNSSFLDSFLSYLNQYPSHTETVQVGRKRCRSGPPRVRGFRKRRRSIDLSQLGETDEEGQANLRHSSSLQLDAPQNMSESEASKSDIHVESSANLQDGILCKFPTRQCTVNLGQKLSLEELKANQDLLSRSRGVSQDKPVTSVPEVAGHEGSKDVMTSYDSSSSSFASPGRKCVPIVSLEPFEKIDVYITQSNIPAHEKLSKLQKSRLVKHRKRGGEMAAEDNTSTDPCAAEPPHVSSQLTSQHSTSMFQSELPGSICSKLGSRLENSAQSCSFQSKFEESALKQSQYSDMLKMCRQTQPGPEITSQEPGLSDIESSDRVSIDNSPSQIESSEFESSDPISIDKVPSDYRSTDVRSLEIAPADIRSPDNGTSNNGSSNNQTSSNSSVDNQTSKNGSADSEASDRSNLKYQDLSRKECVQNTKDTDQNDIRVINNTAIHVSGDFPIEMVENLDEVGLDQISPCIEHSTQSSTLKNERTVMVSEMSDCGLVHCSVVSGAADLAENVVVNLVEESEVVGSDAAVSCQSDGSCVGDDVSPAGFIVDDDEVCGIHSAPAVQGGEGQDLCKLIREETSVGVMPSLGETEHQSSAIGVSAEADLASQSQQAHHELHSQSQAYETIDDAQEKHWTPHDVLPCRDCEHVQVIQEPVETSEVVDVNSAEKLVEIIESLREECEGKEEARCDSSDGEKKLVEDIAQCGDTSMAVVSDSEKVTACEKADSDITDEGSGLYQEDALESCSVPDVELSSDNKEDTTENGDTKFTITFSQGADGTELAEVRENAQVCGEIPFTGDITTASSFTKSAADSHDVKTQIVGENVSIENISSQPSIAECASDDISVETSRTRLAVDASSSSIDRSIQSPRETISSCVGSVPSTVSSSKSFEESLGLDSAKERKQDSQSRANFNSNISLAAFIAERLTKDDLEPASAYKRNANDRASFRLIGADSPLDICSQRTETAEVNCVGYTEILSPLNSYVDVKEYMESMYITHVNDNFSINFGHHIESTLNISHRGIEPVTPTYVTSIDCPSTYVDHSRKEPVISKYSTLIDSPSTYIDHSIKEPITPKYSTHMDCPSMYIDHNRKEPIILKYHTPVESRSLPIDHNSKESVELAYISPIASGFVNIGSDNTEPVRPVFCEPMDKSCQPNAEDTVTSSKSVLSSGLVDYSSSEEEEISTLCGLQKEPSAMKDNPQEEMSIKNDNHEEGTSGRHVSHQGEDSTTCDNHTVAVNHVISFKTCTKSSDLQSDESKISSQVFTTNMISDAQTNHLSSVGCEGNSIGQEHALHEGSIESQHRASNQLTERGVEPTLNPQQSESCGLLGSLLENNPGVEDSQLENRKVTRAEGIVSEHLNDRHPKLVSECMRSVEGKGHSQELSQTLVQVTNDVSEDLSPDIPLCVSPNSSRGTSVNLRRGKWSQVKPVCVREGTTSCEISLYDGEEKLSQNVPVCETKEELGQDIPVCDRKEKLSYDIPLCVSTENQIQDILQCNNRINCQNALSAASTCGENVTLGAGCVETDLSQAGNDSTLKACFRLNDSGSVDNGADGKTDLESIGNGADDKTAFLSDGVNFQCHYMCEVSALDGHHQSTPTPSCVQDGCHQSTPTSSCVQDWCHQSTPTPSCVQDGCHQSTPTSSCVQDRCHQSTPTSSCVQDRCHQSTPTSSCVQDGCHQSTPTSSCVQDGCHQSMPTLSCVQDGCHQSTPTSSCVQDRCHQSMPTLSCVQDWCHQSTPTSSCVQDGCHQSTPTLSCVQDGCHQSTSTSSCVQDGCHLSMPTSSCVQDGCHQSTPTSSCVQDGCHQSTPTPSCVQDGCHLSTSTSSCVEGGHCQVRAHTAVRLSGPCGLTSSWGLEQGERELDGSDRNTAVGDRLSVSSLSGRSQTDTEKETCGTQFEASNKAKCKTHVQGQVTSLKLHVTKDNLAEGLGVCESTHCELAEIGFARGVYHAVPDTAHNKSGDILKCATSSGEISVETGERDNCHLLPESGCKVFTDNMRVNSFDIQSHRRNQEKPAEHERSGGEFQKDCSDRNVGVITCGLSGCQHYDLCEEEVQLLSPVCVDSGIVIDDSVGAMNYATEVVLSHCNAPGCDSGAGSECDRTSRECTLLVPSVCEERRPAWRVTCDAALLEQAISCQSVVESIQGAISSDAVGQPVSSADDKILLDTVSDSQTCFRDSENTCLKHISDSQVSAKEVSDQVFQKLTANLSVAATDCDITLDTGLTSLSEFEVGTGMESKMAASPASTYVSSLISNGGMSRLPTEDVVDVGKTSCVEEPPLKAESDLLKNVLISECENSVVPGPTVDRDNNVLREPSRITQSEMFDALLKQAESRIQYDASSINDSLFEISNKSGITCQKTEDTSSGAPFKERLQPAELEVATLDGLSTDKSSCSKASRLGSPRERTDKNSSGTASRPDSPRERTDKNNTGTASRPESPRERTNKNNSSPDSPRERASLDSEGDDLSDFDLIIENDTSYRSLVSFPAAVEKRSYSSPLQHPISPYISKGKITYLPSSATSSVPASGFTYSKIPTADGHQSLPRQPVGFSSRQPSVTTKTYRKSHRQFVWEDDSGGGRTTQPRAAVLAPSATRHTAPAREAVSDPGLDTLRRKQKSLREKSETAPFSWDLDDNADSLVSSNSGKVKVRHPAETNSDIISFERSSHQRKVATPADKVRPQITPHKRPLTPDASPGRIPAKLRRTFSVDRPVKIVVESVGKDLKRRGETMANEVSKASSVKNSSHRSAKDSHRSAKDSQRSAGNFQRSASDAQRSTTEARRSRSDSITVDEDISFKKDSFSSSGGLTLSAGIQNSLPDNISCVSSHETKGKRERSHKHSHFSSPLDAVLQDCRLESSGQVAGEDSLKNQLGLRSRHSSMESNKSDMSVNTKRAADNNSPFPSKRSQKTEEDPSSPKLKKIGLIKITKDPCSPSAATGSDSAAPVTRSSEAAIKAFHQKSLRSRGVNPCPLAAVSPSATSKIGLQTSPAKSSPETGSRLKSSVSIQKSLPPLSVIIRNSHVESKVRSSPKSSRRKLGIASGTGAVTKRRLLSPPVSSSRAGSAKTSFSLRSRKRLEELGKHPQATGSVAPVNLLPSVALTKDSSKSHVAQSAKETKTLHSQPTTSTGSVRSKRDPTRQQNWRISKDTKFSQEKKRRR